VNDKTLALERQVAGTECRASWEDLDEDRQIDPGETVYWAWNHTSHTNSLVPLFARGVGSEMFGSIARGNDPVRGSFIDNTDVHRVMDSLIRPETLSGPGEESMIVIPEGMFWMGANPAIDGEANGDESPGGLIHLERFAIDKTEVTVAEFRRFIEATNGSTAGLDMPTKVGRETPALAPLCNWGKPDRQDHPMNCVDWYRATAYCEWAGKRLPTEAEWEKAARGNDGRKYPWGNRELLDAGQVANLGGESARRQDPTLPTIEGYDDGFAATSPVGSFPAGASPYGVLDIAGNVWEWTSDWYELDYRNAILTHGVIPVPGDRRSVRGASWKNQTHRARASLRSSDPPGDRQVNVGFR
jgi:formylglycine-generating enzyme required for sulfatase activity